MMLGIFDLDKLRFESIRVIEIGGQPLSPG